MTIIRKTTQLKRKKRFFSLIKLFIILAIPFSTLFSSSSLASHDNSKDEPKLVDKLHQKAPELDKEVLAMAVNAYQKALDSGQVKNHHLTVIDYRLPSNQQRMWVFNVDKPKLDFNTFVAHGKNSGNTYATHFSNTHSSKSSSLGTFITKNTYIGGKGYSLNLQGVEKGVNDHALDRRIVVHGAWYMEKNFINQQGRAGRSWGCPAVSQKEAKPIINDIKNGSVVFAYYPDSAWLSHSQYV